MRTGFSFQRTHSAFSTRYGFAARVGSAGISGTGGASGAVLAGAGAGVFSEAEFSAVGPAAATLERTE